MGLFSKHKKEENSLPPAPPVSPPGAANLSPQSMDNNMPPPPSNSMGGIGQESNMTNPSMSLNAPPIPDVANGSNLSPPPLPGGSLNDIKQQVAGNNAESVVGTTSKPAEPSSSKSSENFSSDSLFEMFDMGGNSNFKEEKPSASVDSKMNMDKSSSEDRLNEGMGMNNKPDNSMPKSQAQDVSFRNNGSLHYASSSSKTMSSVKSVGDSTFLTTSQFKALLEIVEGVKTRVKDSTETHLRLLDMKSEEDLEYENLRKDFQFVEDKLYELDTILFEK